jgi:cellulose synthase/poly-beta-1,6-N-acetylglucosamine synthase-like glycosyltransferase
MYIFSSKDIIYFNQRKSDLKQANLKVSYIAIYRMMAVMPLVFFLDLGLFVGVPVYLFIVFRE